MAEIGQVVNGYEVLGELGKGGMGRVFRVRNVISNRVEAMKILLTDFAPEADLTDRFMGEIHTLAHLEYPNIAKFHTAFKLDNQLVMIMECVEGLTLADQLKQVRIQLPEALSHITQVLSTPTYAHENGVIHRDIKPSNVMITPQEIVKLMDFGIANLRLTLLPPVPARPSAPFSTYLPSNEIIMTALAKEPSHRFQNNGAAQPSVRVIPPNGSSSENKMITAAYNFLRNVTGTRPRAHRKLFSGCLKARL